MVDEGVEMEKTREGGEYHLGWDGDGLGQVQANEEHMKKWRFGLMKFIGRNDLMQR